MIVIILHTTFASIARPMNIIEGYSECSDLLLVENKEHWNFLNKSTNNYENGSNNNCSDALADAEKCPTELTILTRELEMIPKNLFAKCFTRLTFLNMSNCGINEISRNRFTYAEHLIKLDLSRNRISELPSNVFELAPNIEIIDLSNNRIETEGIDEYAFEKCISLKQLDLSNNRLLRIGNDWLIPLVNLEVLNLNDNSADGDGRKKFQFRITQYYNNTNLVTL